MDVEKVEVAPEDDQAAREFMKFANSYSSTGYNFQPTLAKFFARHRLAALEASGVRELEAENERLRAEVQRLRNILNEDGLAWPTLLIARDGEDPDAAPFRLEIPRAVCPDHQAEFQPDLFLSDGGRAYMRFLAASWRMGVPDFKLVTVEWRPVDHPALQAFDGREARFCSAAGYARLER